jgi:GT2 family glycosyltransferase
MQKNILVSVIIVNWNGKKWLNKCLSSIYKQTYKSFEVIFVDNNSSDESVSYVRKAFPKTCIISLDSNTGFAIGNNKGVEKAKGKYIYLHNTDAVLTKDGLAKMVAVFEKSDRIGSLQPMIRLLNNSDTIDSCGSFWTDSTFLYHFGNIKSYKRALYNRPMKVFSNLGASMMIRKSLISDIGLFDEAFWNYYEETDFCHRVWLSGYEVWYYPVAVCFHAKGGTAIIHNQAYIQYHNYKNKLRSFLKNYSGLYLLYILPVFLGFLLVLSGISLFQGKFDYFITYYKAIWWNVLHLPDTLSRRKQVQKIRIKSDWYINSVVKRNPRLSYYYYLFVGLQGYAD